MEYVHILSVLFFHFQMSKSKGNVVDPFEQMSKFGVDPLRFFLLREGSLQQDGGNLSFCLPFYLP